jgi:choice-of-anchor A domain-containing protein/uncharacterized repeat protein (TIGR01451 family)
MSWHQMFDRLPSRTTRRTRRARTPRPRWHFALPRLEALEDRTLFATSLGTALNYNALIFGSLTAASGDTEGRLTVDGNATFTQSYGVGLVLPSDPTRDDLIVGGNLINQASWSVNANAVYGGTITGGNTLFHRNGTTRQQSPILLDPATGNAVTAGGESFAQLQDELIDKSTFWGSLPDQGVVTKTVSNGTLTLVGNDPTLDVFNVTADQWAGPSTSVRDITAPPGATVLINVSGQPANIVGGSMHLFGTDVNHVLMNFFNATTITSTNFQYVGSVLAPLASATLGPGGDLEGVAIFGGDVNEQNGFEFHNRPFRGQLPDITAPTVSTQQSATAALVGTSISDTAMVTGGVTPYDLKATVTFNLFNNPNGTGPALFTDIETLVNGTATSKRFTPTTPGSDYWVATFNGDSNNPAASSGLAAEPVNIVDARISISPLTPVNEVNHAETFTITVTASPAGTGMPTFHTPVVTFPTGTPGTVIGPTGETISGNVATWTVTINNATAGTFTVQASAMVTMGGVTVTRTMGDGLSGDSPSAVKTYESITTNAGPTVTLGDGTPLTDSATLAGGTSRTGTVNFDLFAPGVNPNQGGKPVYTDVVMLTAPVPAPVTVTTSMGDNPGGFLPTAAGTYQWVVTYSGDASNVSVASNFGDEPQTVNPPTPPQADVMLTKLVNQTNPIFGTPVTYTLLAHNNGPNTATGVVVTDVLPAGLVFVSATASQGSFDPGSGRWTIGTLPNGATATLQITDIVLVIGPITNTSSVAASELDSNPANNVSSVTIDGLLAAGQLSKRSLLSSGDAPSNAAVLAAEEALFNALVPMWLNLWDALLSAAQSMLAVRDGPSNGGVAVFQGDLLGSPLVVYANPFAGQVTAVQVGALDFLYENNAVASVRLL